jgi:hypothetical protein
MESILGKRKDDVVSDVLAAVHVRTTVAPSSASAEPPLPGVKTQADRAAWRSIPLP